MNSITQSAGKLDAEKLGLITDVIENYKGTQGSLIQVLHEAQDIYGYLPPELQKLIARELKIPLSTVSGVVTFYSYFSTVPKAKHTIKICMGTACYVRGGSRIVEALQDKLKIPVGGTTEDGKFSIQITRCLGACGLAPVIMIDEDIHQKVTAAKIDNILNNY